MSNGNFIPTRTRMSKVKAIMSQYWVKHGAKDKITDQQLKKAIRNGIGK